MDRQRKLGKRGKLEGERLAETGDERGFPYSMLDHGRGGWRGARVKLILWRERKKWHATRLRNLRHRLEIRLIGGNVGSRSPRS